MVDAHTHLFGPDVVRRREALLGQEPWFGALYANPAAVLAGEADLLATMDAAGVQSTVACGFPWSDLGRCRSENDILADVSRRGRGRVAWVASVSPRHARDAAREAERAFAAGASGLGELNADGQGFDLADPVAFAPVARVCIEADRPVLLHASEPVGHAYPGKGTATPEKLLAFVTAFPELKVVLAHWGGGLPFYELMPEVAVACRNVWYDTAASTYLYKPAVFRAVLDIVGPAKVLWGSDYPVLGMGRFLRRCREDAGVRDDEAPGLFGENARRVYGLADRGADRA